MSDASKTARVLTHLVSQAITDYSVPMSQRAMLEHARMVRAEAGEWINSSSKAPFSLCWVCDRLGIEPRDVRKAAESASAKNRRRLRGEA